MATKTDSFSTIGKIYAEVLFEIAQEKNLQDEFYENIKSVNSVMDNSEDLNRAMISPIVEKKDKYAILDEVFKNKFDRDFLNFLKILCQKNRFDSLKQIENQYKKINLENKGIKEFDVISAFNLSQNILDKIKDKLKDITKNDVILNLIIDKSIIGGVLIKSDSEEIDLAIKTKLSDIKTIFKS